MGVGVILAAAGRGQRMGAEENKVFLPLESKPILAYSLELFSQMEEVAELIIVIREVDRPLVEDLLKTISTEGKRVKLVIGGSERQESVYFGLKALSAEINWVIIHDGARPYLTEAVVRTALKAAKTTRAVGVGVPVKDTIKKVQRGFVVETPPRNELWAIQTPQIFARTLLVQAHERARQQGVLATDDCALVEYFGHPVQIVEGEYANIKITTPDDLPKEGACLIGFGYDVHRLVEDRPLILAGIEIPHDKGLLGHSDADVVTHAVMDALLGGAGLGDIGEHFPDSDPAYKGISSFKLLKQVMSLLSRENLQVNNLDITIMAQKPKLSQWKGQMRSNLAQIIAVEENRINIKATTGEGLGFIGRKEGIAVQAVASLRPK